MTVPADRPGGLLRRPHATSGFWAWITTVDHKKIGILYGITDGLLLSVFPILVVFAAFAGTRLDRRRSGKVAVGAIALAASLAMTAVYHAGYSDFRSEKMSKPLTGDVMWSVPTLVTLNPIGSPIAHAGLHTAAVLHSYETDTFLPPHK